MCSVLIKFLVTMFINLIFKYVYLEIGPIILDLLIMINCPYHENIYEFTPWILIAINKRKKMKSYSVCIHNLFYEKQLNLALVINAKWFIIYKVLERRQVRDDWIMSPSIGVEFLWTGWHCQTCFPNLHHENILKSIFQN